MKKSVALFLSAVMMAMILFSCAEKPKKFSGYITVGEKPRIAWTVVSNYYYFPMGVIKVVTPEGEIEAWFYPERASNTVVYRDSYPITLNSVVYVSGEYEEVRNNGVKPVIHAASPNKAELGE